MKGMSKAWGDQFNKSVVHLSGRNKVYPLGDKSGGPVVTKTAGLVKAMLDAEATDLFDIKHKDRDSKALAAYAKSVKAFQAEKKTYSRYLADAIKSVDKKMHPEAYRELKILNTQLDALQAKLENTFAGYKNAKELGKIVDKGSAKVDKARKKGDEEGALAEQEAKALKQFMLQLKALGNSGIRKGLAAIQDMKKDPSVANYNKIMNSAGRDVSQWVVNIAKVKTNKKFKNDSTVKKLANPAPFMTQLTEFGNGAKRRIDDTSSPDEVAALIKEFSQLLKSVAVAYEPVLKFKG